MRCGGCFILIKKGKDSKLIHISDILNSALGKYRPAMDTQMTKVWDVWDNTVGKPIAMNAKPDSFKDGLLVVNVSSSSWIHQLKFLEKDMIANLNRRLDTILVKNIRFKIGKILS
jgi:predicted nucleic acid-binding Zn ribbon protein